MRKILSICLLATVILSGCNQTSEKAPTEEKIKIVTYTPLSGEKALEGDSIRLGALLAIEELKKKGVEVEIKSLDSHMEDKKGIENQDFLIETPTETLKEKELDWANEYERTYGKKPNSYSAFGYESTMKLVESRGKDGK